MSEKSAGAPCRVFVDPKIPRGWVELPPDFFEQYGIAPDHHVVLRSRGLNVKLKAKESELLKSCEISMSPHLALYLGVDEAELVDVEDHPTVGDELKDEVESFVEILKQPAEHLEGVIGEEVDEFVGHTVETALDHLVVHKDKPEKSYLEVPPNPEGFGIPRGEICEDPSLLVKEWRPDDGTGKVKVFRPGGEETEDEEE
jgi:hypothetical protein